MNSRVVQPSPRQTTIIKSNSAKVFITQPDFEGVFHSMSFPLTAEVENAQGFRTFTYSEYP